MDNFIISALIVNLMSILMKINNNIYISIRSEIIYNINLILVRDLPQ